MFERFTERARRVVMLAQGQARDRNYHHIGTEHIILGMLEEAEGVGGKALSACGITLEAAIERTLELVPPEAEPSNAHIPFTPIAKKALESALREALQLGHNYIGTEHVLLGILRVGEGAGQQLLDTFSEAGTIRKQVIQLLTGYESKPTPKPQQVVHDWTQCDLIVYTPDHPDGIRVAGGHRGLEDAWELVEEMLLPRRLDRIKWEAAKELVGGKAAGQSA